MTAKRTISSLEGELDVVPSRENRRGVLGVVLSTGQGYRFRLELYIDTGDTEGTAKPSVPWWNGATRSRRSLASRWSGNHSAIAGQAGSQATTGTMCGYESVRGGQVCDSGRSSAWGSSERRFSLTSTRSISPAIPGSSRG